CSSSAGDAAAGRRPGPRRWSIRSSQSDWNSSQVIALIPLWSRLGGGCVAAFIDVGVRPGSAMDAASTQVLGQLGAGPMQPGLHGADGAIDGAGDLLIG